MFDKFSEIISRYEIKNFFDLIEKIKEEGKMKTISEIVEADRESLRVGTNATIIDPLINFKDAAQAHFSLPSYIGKRYDFSQLSKDHFIMDPQLKLL
jgi:hypothetical protein